MGFPDATGTRAAGPGEDPVARLQAALETKHENPAAREADLQRAVAGLSSLAEMRRAVVLPLWSGPGEVSATDRRCRARLAVRFEAGLRLALRGGPAADHLEALRLLTLGPADPQNPPALHAERYFEDVALLTRAEAAVVREAALRTLPRLGADPGAVADVVRPLLCDPEGSIRLAAAISVRDALGEARAASALRGPAAARLGSGLVPLMGSGLSDTVVLVRRACAGGLVQGAEILRDLVGPGDRRPAAADVGEAEHGLEEDLETVGPLARALAAQAPVLAGAVGDSDPEVSQAARQAIEAMASARRAVQGRLRALNALPAVAGSAARRQRLGMLAREDVLREGLEGAVSALAAGLRAPQAATRGAAAETLEALGELAVPAVPALLAALEDRDRFVRWAAARALGQVGAAPAEQAVGGLARALADGDADVRRAALASLAGYGPAARQALPQVLAAARTGDPESRMAALRAVQALGRSEASALETITAALGDREPRVRSLAEGLLKQGAGTGPQAAQVMPDRRDLGPPPLAPDQR